MTAEGERGVDLLTLDDLLEIAAGVLPAVEVRDVGLLAAAADRPRASAFGEDAYPRLVDKAGALVHSLARNHPLVDGNTRLAWAATRVLLLLDGRDVASSVDDAEAFVLSVATGERDAADAAAWLADHLT